MTAPTRRKTLGSAAQLQVGAAHRIAQFEQHFGQSAHADSADTDEVDRLTLEKHFNYVLFRLLTAVSIALRKSTEPRTAVSGLCERQ